MAQGPDAWADAVGRAGELPVEQAIPLADVELRLPFAVADYVDFYSSLEHATNLGRHVPARLRAAAAELALAPGRLPRPRRDRRRQRHGGAFVRAASRVRPGRRSPTFGPSRRLDIELELGFVVGVPSRLGEAVPPEAFADHVFGVVLVNDWSARDLQAWEYQPLGPFLGKSFATSISAWVTPLALLEPARVEAPPQEPPPLPHLAGGRDWALDLDLSVELNGAEISRGNARGLYWTMPQQLAHATSNGASIRTGDLMASGTISGQERGSEGSLIELTRNGAEPVSLGAGGERTFLEDGDEVVLRGRAANGVELGEVRGRIAPARG